MKCDFDNDSSNTNSNGNSQEVSPALEFLAAWLLWGKQVNDKLEEWGDAIGRAFEDFGRNIQPPPPFPVPYVPILPV